MFGLQVNGVSVVGVAHATAVDALKRAGNQVTLVSSISFTPYILKLAYPEGVRTLPIAQLSADVIAHLLGCEFAVCDTVSCQIFFALWPIFFLCRTIILILSGISNFVGRKMAFAKSEHGYSGVHVRSN